MLWWLLIGHALCDYPLQADFLARGKNRHSVMTPPPGAKPQTIWPYCLTAHALIHAGFVLIITGSPLLSAAEAASHWLIDYAKCENWTGIHWDQWLHVWCKVLWVVAVVLSR